MIFEKLSKWGNPDLRKYSFCLRFFQYKELFLKKSNRNGILYCT